MIGNRECQKDFAVLVDTPLVLSYYNSVIKKRLSASRQSQSNRKGNTATGISAVLNGENMSAMKTGLIVAAAAGGLTFAAAGIVHECILNVKLSKKNQQKAAIEKEAGCARCQKESFRRRLVQRPRTDRYLHSR